MIELVILAETKPGMRSRLPIYFQSDSNNINFKNDFNLSQNLVGFQIALVGF